METIDIIFSNFMSTHNFNHNFYQTHNLHKATTQKSVLSKIIFLNQKHKSNYNSKNTLGR
jgi:hypothetical protein